LVSVSAAGAGAAGPSATICSKIFYVNVKKLKM